MILLTKLFTPQLSNTFITRPRLLAKLSNSFDKRRLTLVAAPAGFGKTTLVAGWLKSLESITASWYSLDSSDNATQQFLIYFAIRLKLLLCLKCFNGLFGLRSIFAIDLADIMTQLHQVMLQCLHFVHPERLRRRFGDP